MPNFRGFCTLGKKLRGIHNFEKKEVIVLGEKIIISSEILAVILTQMNFNCRQREIDLRFKMSYDLYYRQIDSLKNLKIYVSYIIDIFFVY